MMTRRLIYALFILLVISLVTVAQPVFANAEQSVAKGVEKGVELVDAELATPSPELAVESSIDSKLQFSKRTALPAGDAPDVTMSLLKVTGGLALVIIAILGSAWAYRRYGNLAPVSNDALRVLGGVSMGQKERVVLMQVGEEQILLGVTPGSIQRLHILAKNIEIDATAKPEHDSFSTQLNAAVKLWKSK